MAKSSWFSTTDSLVEYAIETEEFGDSLDQNQTSIRVTVLMRRKSSSVFSVSSASCHIRVADNRTGSFNSGWNIESDEAQSFSGMDLDWTPTIIFDKNYDATRQIDGSLEIRISAYINGLQFDSGWSAGFDVTITSQNRVSVVSTALPSVVVNGANTSQININKLYVGATHTLRYEFVSAVGTIRDKSLLGGAISYGWAPGTNLLFQIPASNSGICKIFCDTYIGNIFIGTSECSLTLNVPDYQPSATFSKIVVNPGTVSSNLQSLCIQNISRIGLNTQNASSFYGATIVNISTTMTQNGTILAIQSIQNSNSMGISSPIISSNSDIGIYTVVTDSRGKIREDTRLQSVTAYSKPVISSLVVQRCDLNGNLTEAGTYVLATPTFTWSSGIANNTLVRQYSYKRQTDSTYAATNIISGTIETTAPKILSYSGFNIDNSYDIRLSITDNISSVVFVEKIIFSQRVLMDFKSDGTGIAIGKVSETINLLDINMPTKITGDFTVAGTSSVIFPTGSIYGTTLHTITDANKIPTNAIKDNAVTGAASNAIGAARGKLGLGAVKTDDIAALAVTDSKIDTMSSTKLTGTIDVANRIAESAIPDDKLKTRIYSGTLVATIDTGQQISPTYTITPGIDTTPSSPVVVYPMASIVYTGTAYRPVVNTSAFSGSSFTLRACLTTNATATANITVNWMAIAIYA